jgi:hypothetical protein
MDKLIKIDLKYCFYFLGAASLVCALFAISFIPKLPARKHSSLKVKLKESFGLDIFKKWRFNLWMFANVFGNIIIGISI